MADNVAEEDLERVLKKLDEIENRLAMGISPGKAIEKRLSGNWSPLLQQRAGKYRLWFVEGNKVERGEDDVVYCIRVLPKDIQQKLMGVDINPETYL
ncbi:MAG: hypothetical protein ABEJ36_01140 [Candidatus Nanosalina sp.]